MRRKNVSSWPQGEGYKLRRALGKLPGVHLDHFLSTPERRTFTYAKPLILEPGKPPRELERLDRKNWTPATVSAHLTRSLSELSGAVDGSIVMDQVDLLETGVGTAPVLVAMAEIAHAHPTLPVIADSRRGLHGYPPLIFKMNAAELVLRPRDNAGYRS